MDNNSPSYRIGHQNARKSDEKNFQANDVSNSVRATSSDEDLTSREVKVSDVWTAAVSNSKQKQMEKVDMSLFASPILAQRVNYSVQKKLVMELKEFQISEKVSAAELSRLYSLALEMCGDFNPNRSQDQFNVFSVNDSFPLNDCQVYNLNSFQPPIITRVQRALTHGSAKSATGYIPLQCCVFGDNSSECDLRLVAIAFRLDMRHCFVALSIRRNNNYTGAVSTGPRKIGILLNVGQVQPGDDRKVVEKVVNIQLSSTSSNMYDDHDALQIETDEKVLQSLGGCMNTSLSSRQYHNENTADNPHWSAQHIATCNTHNECNSDEEYGYRPGDTSSSEDDDQQDGMDVIDISPPIRQPYRTNREHQRLSDDTSSDRRQQLSTSSPQYHNNYTENVNSEVYTCREEQAPLSSGRASDNRRIAFEPSLHSRSHSRDSSRSRSRSSSVSTHSYDSFAHGSSSSPYRLRDPDSSSSRHHSQGRDRDSEEYDPSSWDTQYSSAEKSTVRSAFTTPQTEDRDGFSVGGDNSNGNSSGKQTFSSRVSHEDVSKPSSVARVASPPCVQLSGVNVVDPDYWRVDEKTLCAPVSVSLSLDLHDVLSTHCSSNLFVLEGREHCTLFTGTLKSTTTCDKYVVNHDKVFRWSRGAYMRGWLMKWPTNSQQKLARPAQRYFVLKDNTLSYHRAEIRQDDDMLSTSATKFFTLDSESSVKIGVHNLQRCVKVKTSVAKLWLATVDAGDEDLERRWMEQISKAIITSASPMSPSQMTVHHASTWHHDSSRMRILSSDALAAANGYGFIRAALFELSGLTGTPKGRLFSPSSKTRVTESFGSGIYSPGGSTAADSMHNTYFVELGSESVDKLKLEVLLTNESPVLPCTLCSVKVFCSDMVVLGGTEGYLAIGAVGKTTGRAEGRARKVMYFINCRPPPPVISASSSTKSGVISPNAVQSKAYPHADHCTVTTLACGVTANVFAAADNVGVISLWFLDRDDESLHFSEAPGKTSAPFYYKIKPALQCSLSTQTLRDVGDDSDCWRGERILSMQFICDDRYLLVSSTHRVFVLLVVRGNDATYTFAGWVEIDRVLTSNSIGLFSFHITEQEVFDPSAAAAALSSRTQNTASHLAAAITRDPGRKKVGTKITYWRALQTGLEVGIGNTNKSTVTTVRYTVSKFEWTSAMFISILKQMQPLQL